MKTLFGVPCQRTLLFSSYLVELHVLDPPRNLTLRQTRRPVSSWARPPGGFAKFDVDGAFSRNGSRCEASAVCRDSNVTFLGSSAMVFMDIDHSASFGVTCVPRGTESSCCSSHYKSPYCQTSRSSRFRSSTVDPLGFVSRVRV